MRGATTAGRIKGLLLCYFNPRTPCGVRPDAPQRRQPCPQFQSTHPVRGATRIRRVAVVIPDISIHAPRAGCDSPAMRCPTGFLISIHAPRAGCDDYCNVSQYPTGRFQSTHPVRGATYSDASYQLNASDFNPRTPCGVRRSFSIAVLMFSNFNPRTPCGVRREEYVPNTVETKDFNPRTPCGVRHSNRSLPP